MEGKLKNSKISFTEFKNYQRRTGLNQRQRKTFMANNVFATSERGNPLLHLIYTFPAIFEALPSSSTLWKASVPFLYFKVLSVYIVLAS